MHTLTARTAAIRIAILLVSVCAFDCVAVLLAKQPLLWARWIPGLIPIFAPLTIWEVFRDSGKRAK